MHILRRSSVALLPVLRLPVLLLPLLLPACTAKPAAESQPTPIPGVATASAVASSNDRDLLAQGEYIVRIAGCNDCHTPGYAEAGGDLPKSQWLMGSPLGWHGPWGTTYPANLRLKLQDMDEAAWIQYSSQLHTRPPMPDFALRTLNDQDRLAVYRFVKSLGPGGQAAPAYLPPGQQPPMPYVDYKMPPPQAVATH